MNRTARVSIEGRVNLDTTNARAQAAQLSQQVSDVEKAGRAAAAALETQMRSAAQAMTSDLAREMRSWRDELRRSHLAGSGAVPNLSRATALLENTGPALAGATSAAQVRQIESRVNIAEAYLRQAQALGLGGAAGDAKTDEFQKRLDDLRTALEAAKKATDANTKAQGGGPGGGAGGGAGGSAGGAANQQQPPPWLQAMMQSSQRGLGQYGGAGLNMLGPVGGILRMLGPWGLGIGAGVWAFNTASRILENATQGGREQVIAAADLARQFGYSGNANALFRDPSRWGATDPAIARYGFSATDAARIASRYDVPGGLRGDVTSILGFSRTTGLDADMTAGVAQALARTGANRPGDVGANLAMLKLAMAEGIKMGLGQSETMRAILSSVEANARRGINTTRTSLAFNAGLLEVMARTGNRALMGEAGAGVSEALRQGVTGANDPGLQMIAMHNLGQYSAKDLGLEGANARQFENLRRQSPFMANRIALQLVAAGRAPQLLKRLMSNLEQQSGGRGSMLLDLMLEQFGIGPDARLGLEAMGLGNLGIQARATSQRNTSTTARGIDRDAQAGNALERQSRALTVLEADKQYLEAIRNLALLGNIDATLRGLRADVINLLSRGAIGLSGQNPFAPGSYAGTVGPYMYLPPPPLPPTDPRVGAGNPQTPTYTAPSVGGTPAQVWGNDLRTLFPGATVTQQPGANANNAALGYGPAGHTGMDLAIPGSGAIPNPFEGARVVLAGPGNDGYGIRVKLALRNGGTAIFGHLRQLGPSVFVGRELRRGELIGYQGRTGNATGPHLHLEMRDAQGRAATTPQRFLEQYAAAATAPGSVSGVPPELQHLSEMIGPNGLDTQFANSAGLARRLVPPRFRGVKDPIPDKVAQGGPEAMMKWISSLDRAKQDDVWAFLRNLEQWRQNRPGAQNQQGQNGRVPVALPDNTQFTIGDITPQAAAKIAAATKGQSVKVTPGTPLKNATGPNGSNKP